MTRALTLAVAAVVLAVSAPSAHADDLCVYDSGDHAIICVPHGSGGGGGG